MHLEKHTLMLEKLCNEKNKTENNGHEQAEILMNNG